jgi:hypothetical protein
VAISGHLQPFDMPDRSVRHRVEVVAYEIEHHVIPAAVRSLQVKS